MARRWIKRVALGDRATEEDVYYCYRLILGREPDPQGWTYYRSLIDKGGVSVQHLALSFLSSVEFRRRNLLQLDPGEEPELVDLGAFQIYVPGNDPVIGAKILDRRIYEPHMTGLLERLLESGMTFVDVGANVGYFSLLAARKVAGQGKVIAIEPSPGNCRLLWTSVRKNGFENVEIHPFAVAEKKGAVVYYGAGSNGTVGDLSGAAEAETGGQIVPSTTIDDLCAERDRVDVIKMDIEGAEYRALIGAARTLGRLRPQILSEFSPDLLQSVSGVSGAAYLARIIALGYEIAVIDSDGEGELSRCGRDVEAVLERFRKAEATHIDLFLSPGSTPPG
jgi:FkbM family methyltransferase